MIGFFKIPIRRSFQPRPDFSPERIFKVVFIGDSAVGKTCFLHRFCHNRFKPLFNATIGVDFTVKNIRLGNRTVAVQLWDTAGQERSYHLSHYINVISNGQTIKQYGL